MTYKISLLSFVFAGLLLSGCSGYEAVRVDSFPYGNQRTAGTGYAYVLKKIAPEKKLKIEPYVAPEPALVPPPVEEPRAEPMPEDKEFKNIEDNFKDMFKKKQQK